MGTSYVITSGKGGVGKTTITANLGAGLAALGKTVILIDMDLGLKNLDVALDLEWNVKYDLIDVIDGVCRPEEALVADPRHPGLYLMAAKETCDKNAVATGLAKALVTALKPMVDYVLIDCPAGIEHGFENAVSGADAAILVLLAELSSLRDGDRIAGILQEKGVNDVNVIVNQVRPELIKKEPAFAPDRIAETLGLPLLGVVPDDVQVIRSLTKGVPVVTTPSPAGAALKNICRRIAGEDVPLMDLSPRRLRALSRRLWRRDPFRGA